MPKSTPKSSVPRPAPVSGGGDAAARVDKDLVASAYRKLTNKLDLTKPERAALKRHEKAKEEQLRWQYYGSIPQKHWRAMSGRQTKVINEQAARYGIPFGGASIDLSKVAKALHDFLADNAVKLAAAEPDAVLAGGPGSPAVERYREERALLAKLDRMEREGKLMPRDQVREALGRIAAILRSAGDTLGRQAGQQAVELLYEALDDANREVERSFGGNA